MDSRAAFSLIELLVGAAIAGVVLAAAWGWLWAIGSTVARRDDGVQAGSLAAAITRGLTRDIGLATEVLRPEDGRDPAGCLLLAQDTPDEAGEKVLIAWDAARGVVWRKAPGTYLSDHVTRFAVSYMTADGRRIDASDVTVDEWPAVRLVRIEITVRVGGEVEQRTLETRVGPA